MKNLVKLCMVLAVLFTTSCDQDTAVIPNDDSGKYGNATSVSSDMNMVGSKSTADIFDITFTKVLGTSTLYRNEDGISVTYETSGLTPGHVYTLWWVVWNKPENCTIPFACGEPDFEIADQVEVEVLNAYGHVADERGGIGTFTANLKENDNSESVNPVFGLPYYGGLHDAQTAEIHLVLRSHGPAIRGKVYDQMSSYEGGCDVSFPPFTQVPSNPGECGDMQAAVHQI